MTEAKDLQLIFHILKYCERIKKVITFLDNLENFDKRC